MNRQEMATFLEGYGWDELAFSVMDNEDMAVEIAKIDEASE